jgi:flagellar biosynthetic protein FliR
MDLFRLNEAEILLFGLALLRISSFFMTWPVFSIGNVPSPIKVLLSVAATMAVMPALPRTGLEAKGFELALAGLAIKEVAIGLFMGAIARLIFYAVEIGGAFASTSMGFSSATIFNPATGSTTSIIEKFYVVLLTLLFLSLNAHHAFLSALVESFVAFPPAHVTSGIGPNFESLQIAGSSAANGVAVSGGTGWAGGIVQLTMVAGIKMAAPVAVVIFFLNVAMGIVGRAVPQINVLITSLPVNIVAGLMVMIVSLPALMMDLDQDLVRFIDVLYQVLRASK